MGVLPPTGTAISFNRTTHAYYNVSNVGASVAGSYNPAIGRTPYAQNTPFSAVFGGRTTPFTY